jgi:predicted nucleotide-binding protein/FMN phosphatase YigB (HAD superfamily)
MRAPALQLSERTLARPTRTFKRRPDIIVNFMTGESRAANTGRLGAAGRPLFIGSSVEGLPIARLFCEALFHDADTALWCQGVFNPSDFTLDSLEEALDAYPFALIVLSPDDVVRSRGTEENVARDNAIFELGLFIGRHGRKSVFIAVPDAPRLRLPTDILGLTPVQYKTIRIGGETSYDVSAATSQIVRAMKKRPARVSAQARPSAFWDVLSDTIVILYGVERELGSHPRHRVSLRDLQTAWELKSFLDRRYPTKNVLPVPATDAGWEMLTQTGADLVVVGGFVTNSEFAQHRAQYERDVRIKMGRLCVVDGQRIYVPAFTVSAGRKSPDLGDPEAIEEFPTDLTSRDFGFVFNGSLHMYGRERRVVAVAGVKGHGTRGAALYLCNDRWGIDNQIGATLTRTDTLEAAIAVDVVRGVVDALLPIHIRKNGVIIHDTGMQYSRPCELSRPCEGCEFGLAALSGASGTHAHKLTPSQIKAIVFDLDDTLIDTFGSLIVPLELLAAKAMIDAGTREKDIVTVASTLLRIRREAPGDMERQLRHSGIGCSPKALAVRRDLLESIGLDNLVVSPEVIQLLRRLRNHFEIHLLTSGVKAFQDQKIDHLNIRQYFTDVIIVSSSSYQAKATALRALAQKRGLPNSSIVVVGNRLDGEIAAAKSLGMPSVWVKHGEGGALPVPRRSERPDFTIDQVIHLEKLIWE